MRPDFDLARASTLRETLNRYAAVLHPWAEATAARVVADLEHKDAKSWGQLSERMSRGLRRELATAPTGEVLRQFLGEQVRLITSLPTEAADRVHRLTVEGLSNSTRASEIAREIMRSGEVTQGRANTIARAEVSRTASTLTEVRARHIGSEGYTWVTADDSDVRPSHRAMQGKIVRWDEPPTLDGMKGHAGCTPNCRCWPRVILPEVIL